MPIRNFTDLEASLSRLPRRRLAVINGTDDSTVSAIARALSVGNLEVAFVGAQPDGALATLLTPYADRIASIPLADEDEAARRAVELVRQGEADFLMKGLIHTDNLLRAVLDKEHGLLPQGRVLTHVAVAEVPGFPRLLFYTDAAVIPVPSRGQREEQVRYLDRVCRAFGIDRPRIALVHFTEKASEKFPCTMDYRLLAEASARGEWGGTVIDGPLDVRTAVDPVALATKGIPSPLQGGADALVFPDLEAANAFYKTLSFFARARQAGMLQGTVCPVVVSSRGDDTETKFLSLAAAACTIDVKQ